MSIGYRLLRFLDHWNHKLRLNNRPLCDARDRAIWRSVENPDNWGPPQKRRPAIPPDRLPE